MNVYLRERSIGSETFLEYYLVWSDTGLELPKVCLDRFESRITAKFSLASCLGPDVKKGYFTAFKEFELSRRFYTPDSIWLHIKFVNSKAPEKCTKRTREDIQRDGVWATFSDCVPRGGSPDLLGHAEHMALLENFGLYKKNVESKWPTVEHRATFMGLLIKDEVYRVLYAHMDELYDFAAKIDLKATKASEPRVVYHGTSTDSLKGILQYGLRTTYGMFGSAVYFGTFWKSARFAYMTQDYQKRPGSILRCLAFWPSPALWSIRSDPCKCAECFGRKGHADHLGLWKAKSHWVLAYPELDGPIKNEEYASIDASKIFIDTIGHIECTEEHHEPWARSQCIL